MDSRIILTQADFSGNNIGRYVELSDLTKKVLAKQTQYDEQSDEAVALNTFLKNLTSAGYIGGNNPLLKSLIIPALASNHDQLLYNIAYLDGNGYPTNEMAAEEIAAESKAYIPFMSNDKVIGLHAGATDIGNSLYRTQAAFNSRLFAGKQVGDAYPSFSIVAFIPSSTYDFVYENPIVSNNALNNTINANFNSVNISRVVNPGILRSASIADEWQGFCGITYNINSAEFSGVINGTTLGSTTGDADRSSWKIQSNSELFRIGRYATMTSRQAKVSLLAFGDEMTTEQLSVLKGHVDTLMTALHAINS